MAVDQRLPSILMIAIYFGKLPWYFDLFLKSCCYNKTIDFIIVIDDATYLSEPPKNVKIVFSNLDRLRDDFSLSLQFKISLCKPYKICDFRPAFGDLFSTWISDYDFWGHVDIDVVFGDIRYFLHEKVLQDFDVISVRPEYITGFCALYRNTRVVNTFYKESQFFKQIFQTEEYLGFDECGMQCTPLMKGFALHKTSPLVDSITHLLALQADSFRINVYFDLHVVEGVPGFLTFEEGRLIFRDAFLVMLYHLISFKSRFPAEYSLKHDWVSLASKFTITQDEILFDAT